MNIPLTPHGPGFRFVDRFEKTGPDSGAGWKLLEPSMAVFADHFPGRPLLPAVLMIECAAQAAGVLWMSGGKNTNAALFLAGVEQFRALRPVPAGKTLETRVHLVKELGDLAMFEFESYVDEVPAARGRLTMSKQVPGEQQSQ
jgi:3-hydroxyacyl-[acyl-carrier-protein] dehydratase